ncbi:TonB-dependent receptor [Sphingomonas flavalba]|uniref:TonB-dependent receptor n=1 Tax=Sphingomonas flavalba TaxID=2559804 RepID=UPI001444FE89|nr:TonB-dependent receptor [Sphingomonas flavalba]
MAADLGSCVKALMLTTGLVGLAPAMAQGGGTPDDIVVTGRRAADRAAIEEKRLSDNQVDAVRGDDVGRLPDQNVAEAVRRLPGLSVANDQGEGRYLTVRGVGPELLNVTLNGQTAPAPEPDGRQVKLDDIPSALIGSVTVVKTLTPDLDANAIAGQANIQTLTAFDRGKTFVTGKAAVGYYQANHKKPYEVDLTAGALFGANKDFGAVLSFSRSDRKLWADNVGASENWVDVNGHVIPDEFSIRRYATHRTRTGAVANFDWRPSTDVKTFLRFTYSKYEDSESRQHFGAQLPVDDPAEITNQTATSGDYANGSADRRVRTRQEATSSFSGSAGGEFMFGDSQLNVEGTYSRAKKRDPHRDEWTFKAKKIGGSYDFDDYMVDVSPLDAAYDPSKFTASKAKYESRLALENLYQARVDFRTPLEIGDSAYFKTGAKYVDRRKSNDKENRAYSTKGPMTIADVLGADVGNIYKGTAYPFGQGIDAAAADAYLAAHQGEFKIDDESSLSDSLAGDYRIRERVLAGYVMASAKFGAFTIVPGVRMEHTRGRFAGKTITDASTFDQGFDSFGRRSYTDFFPGINLRFDPAPGLTMRGAVTRAIGRPNYEDIAPYVLVNVGDREVSLGNPDLKPLYATNFDAAVEYYIGKQGILSAAFFHKRIENPIFLTGTTVLGGTYAGQTLPTAFVTQPQNADDARVTGLELNAQMELSFLPSPLDGFSVGASMTFVKSRATGIPGRTDSVRLANQSNRVASAQLTYEKYGISARVAYTYRSRYLDTVGETRDGDQYVDNFNQFDARIGYAITPNFNIFVEGANLNDEPQRRFIGIPRHLVEIERYGWSAKTGIQLNF